MRIAVVGAGIVGVASAHALAAQGHAVTVFERRGSVAEETSFANAGVVAPGYVTPWAAPGMLAKVLQQMPSRHAAIRLARPWPALPWLWRWWRACAPAAYARHRRALLDLATYSQQRLHEVCNQHRLDFERSQGYLVLMRGRREAAAAQATLKLLAEAGAQARWIDAGEARQIEPGLAQHTPLEGAIHLPGSEVGNCRQFAHLLRHESQRLGAAFRFGREVQALTAGPLPALSHRAASGSTAEFSGSSRQDPDESGQATETFDAIVVCAALESAPLLRPLGLALPLTAVHGYSITLPLRAGDAVPERAPRAGLMDERFKVAITRLGQRVRVAGSAEVGGSLARHRSSALGTLYKVLNDWFPMAAQPQAAQVWKGARPTFPEGPPVIGPVTQGSGIWLNLGHGSSGWALACGSAAVLADLIAGRAPDLDPAPFEPSRYRR